MEALETTVEILHFLSHKVPPLSPKYLGKKMCDFDRLRALHAQHSAWKVGACGTQGSSSMACCGVSRTKALTHDGTRRNRAAHQRLSVGLAQGGLTVEPALPLDK
eukprot:scaffold294169_cov19-Tisochrysis_lutea.AAC.1